MKKTLARIKFKKNFGNANQFFVTSMVALHHLNSSDLKEAPKELHTSWSPHDRKGTICRSRNFVKQSFLAWAVDSIDMYVTLLNRKPKYLQQPKEQLIFEKAKRSVYQKALNLGAELEVTPATLALLEVLITWRNNSLHSLAENIISEGSINILQENKEFICNNYRGLDPTSLPEKVHSGANLTFKETASLINVAHKYVEEIDTKVISNLDKKQFSLEAITDKLRSSKEFSRKYYSLRGIKRNTMMKNWLQNNLSYTDADPEIIESCCCISKKANQ